MLVVWSAFGATWEDPGPGRLFEVQFFFVRNASRYIGPDYLYTILNENPKLHGIEIIWSNIEAFR